MKGFGTKRSRASADQATLPDLSAGKVEPGVRKKAAAAVAPKRQRAVWTSIKRKSSMSQLQLHLPGMGGIIQ